MSLLDLLQWILHTWWPINLAIANVYRTEADQYRANKAFPILENFENYFEIKKSWVLILWQTNENGQARVGACRVFWVKALSEFLNKNLNSPKLTKLGISGHCIIGISLLFAKNGNNK